MDKGAHFFRCDFQVHTPRDLRWSGPSAVTDDERFAYGRSLVEACRDRGIQAIAITDHHCMTFLPFVRKAADQETDPAGAPLSPEKRLVVYPGIELTLGVPCQALLIFDADFPNDLFSLATNALAIMQSQGSDSKVLDTVRLNSITTFEELKKKLDEHSFLRQRYIVLPNITGEGEHSLLRKGQTGKYADMHCVGGYIDGEFSKLGAGIKNILAGKDKAWGNKRVAAIQTSDSRRADHSTLGVPSTWIKWATPTAEALRQACLAQESRIVLDEPKVPDTFIASISISNSSFLGPVDLEFNPQYSTLIGGRGTGKSTVLEYIRWALCDQPPAIIDNDTPNYQARRTRLIDLTLRPQDAAVQVNYVLNGVSHSVRRFSRDGSIQMKIGPGDFKPCTEDDVRALLPIQAYSQKQLSDVSVRIEELTRFITAPIKAELDRLERDADRRVDMVRESYATRQRARALARSLDNRVLEARSVAEQAASIRASLTGLSADDQALIAQAPAFNAANNVVNSWQAGAAVLAQRAKDFRTSAQSIAVALQLSPTEPDEHTATFSAARSEFNAILMQLLSTLDATVVKAETISDPEARRGENPWSAWERQYQAFHTRYSKAIQHSSSHAEKLEQLSTLENKLAELARDEAITREQLNALSGAEQAYATSRADWLAAKKVWDNLVDAECTRLTSRSGGVIRVSVKRFADTAKFVELLKQSISGSRIQGSKIEALGNSISTASDPEALWLDIVKDLEALALFDRESAPNEKRPNAPNLLSNGISVGDLDKIAATLTPEDWLSLSLINIGSCPIYEFRARDQEYIPFENASAGQQATALLKTLLNQPGPPLIIDQPEEDLDNPVMIEIVNQIWKAKQLRQIIFASHNANLVVNGDAELVAWFGYRIAGDQSRGMIEGQGAIDVPTTREAIKRIMEGGENAFRLRREKYGF
ncbi:hypothetical protein E0H65_14175 [Rhizobium leguminosarum bv. viciae]|nr:hypothetical protein E0H65_14175 [Rhizobium leguminosarum bv. viciae]